LTPAAIRILLPFDSFPSSTLAAARMLPPLDPAVARPQSPFDSTPAVVPTPSAVRHLFCV
jgi:hypothetical protein